MNSDRRIRFFSSRNRFKDVIIPCDTLEEANDIFEAYKYQSIHNYGRAAGEDVSIIDAHSAIIKEHKGHFEHI